MVPLAEQDRSLWDSVAIAEGVSLITTTLATAPIGSYRPRSLHDEADRAEDTDWAQIPGLYDPQHNIAPGPMVTLSVVAVAMAHGPRDELDQLAAAEADPALAEHHRVEAVLATVCVKKQPKLVVF